MARASVEKQLSNECHRTWANVDSDLCRHIVSLGHSELMQLKYQDLLPFSLVLVLLFLSSCHPLHSLYLYHHLTWFSANHGWMNIYIIISKNIRYLLSNRGVWRFFHDTYLTIEVQGIRCTHHLNHSCPLTDVNPHFTSPGCRYYFKINSWWPIVTSSTHGPAARLKWRHNEPLFPRVSMDAWCWGRRELQGLPAKPWIVWHMTSSFCIYIVVLSFSDSRVSTRGINCGAVNCHCPRATHTARTMAL